MYVLALDWARRASAAGPAAHYTILSYPKLYYPILNYDILMSYASRKPETARNL